MEKNIKAVFYKFKYYIFPDEFSDLTKINDGTVIAAKRLKEERCMAPDFIYESVEEESVEIDNAKLLFPVSVNLYSGKEYDEILSKQIDKVCHGCSRFIDNDDESLDGHHREISLDGVCYERETDDDAPTYALRSYWFLCGVADNIDKIKKYIDSGNNKKLDKLCRSFKCIPMPYKFYGDKQDGKYRLFWRSFGGNELNRHLQHFTAKAAKLESSPIKDLNLEIISYIPKGADVDLGKFDENAPVFSVSETRLPNVVEVHVYNKKHLNEKKYDELLFKVHHNLCNRLGEDVLMRTVSGYDVVYNAPDKPINLNQLIELLTNNDNSSESEKRYPSPGPVVWEKQDGALYGRHNYAGLTSCYTFTTLAADSSQIPETDFYGCLAFAYILIPARLENFESVMESVSDYMSKAEDVPEPVMLKESYLGCFQTIGAGACTCDDAWKDVDKTEEPAGIDGIALDFLVADENAFFRFIKILAPVLRFYDARLVVVNGSGVNVYKCDYKITPIDSTDMN
ncbi:MAG: hypothetical protein K2K38_00025 [Clostridia bacterium]|nr:hypothetical protein [Clostridia bacterium]